MRLPLSTRGRGHDDADGAMVAGIRLRRGPDGQLYGTADAIVAEPEA